LTATQRNRLDQVVLGQVRLQVDRSVVTDVADDEHGLLSSFRARTSAPYRRQPDINAAHTQCP